MTPVPENERVPTADFFRPAIFRNPTINPAGTHIAALIASDDDHYGMIVHELQTKKAETIGAFGDKDIYQVFWLGDKRVMFSLANEKLYAIGLFAADLKDFARAYPLLQYGVPEVVSIPIKDRARPLVWYRDEPGANDKGGVVSVDSNLHLGKYITSLTIQTDTTGGAWTTLLGWNDRHIRARYSMPPGMCVGYYADKEGELAYAVTSSNGLFSLYWLADGEWQKSPSKLEDIDVVAAGDNPGEVIVRGPREADKPRPLQVMDVKTGKLGEVYLQDPGYDFTGWLYRDPSTHAIVGAIFERNGPSVVWFSEAYRALQKVLDGFFPGMVVRLFGSDEASKNLLVGVSSDRQPMTYYWVDLDKRSVGLIKNSAPWIDPKRMQPMNILKFKTRDGKKLDAYLTLPAGASKQNPAPLVVYAHGGPWARDNWGFNGEVQFLASRGYAVLQPNYRGSTGYNWMFPQEDEWEFRKMHDDVTDAVKTVVASGYVDPGRIAIMGGSFGGYLALSGVVNEPDLYKCAATFAGVFDWATQIKETKYYRYDDIRYALMTRKLGDPDKQREKFAAISPLRHVDQAKVPILVAHGYEDRTVDIGESKRLVAELDRYKIPHETYFFHGEAHGLSRVKDRVELFEHIDAFLAKYLKPAPPAPGAQAVQAGR